MAGADRAGADRPPRRRPDDHAVGARRSHRVGARRARFPGRHERADEAGGDRPVPPPDARSSIPTTAGTRPTPATRSSTSTPPAGSSRARAHERGAAVPGRRHRRVAPQPRRDRARGGADALRPRRLPVPQAGPASTRPAARADGRGAVRARRRRRRPRRARGDGRSVDGRADVLDGRRGPPTSLRPLPTSPASC